MGGGPAFAVYWCGGGRHDDNMNVLVIAADYTSFALCKKLVAIFLETKFVPEERYVRRLSEIKKMESDG